MRAWWMPPLDGVGDQLLVALAPGLAVIDLRDAVCRSASKESALTPEKVPTPPPAAQAPELSPLEIEMPLPPSTSGRTSRPEMMMGFKRLHGRLSTSSSRQIVAAADVDERRGRSSVMMLSAPQPCNRRRHGRVVDRIHGQLIAQPA